MVVMSEKRNSFSSCCKVLWVIHAKITYSM
jgi:hypothetical protein